MCCFPWYPITEKLHVVEWNVWPRAKELKISDLPILTSTQIIAIFIMDSTAYFQNLWSVFYFLNKEVFFLFSFFFWIKENTALSSHKVLAENLKDYRLKVSEFKIKQSSSDIGVSKTTKFPSRVQPPLARSRLHSPQHLNLTYRASIVVLIESVLFVFSCGCKCIYE